MSEVITENEQTVTYIKHTFYCDDCGKHLIISMEDDAGYYEEPDEFYIQHVKLKGHYCLECGRKRVNDVIAYGGNANDKSQH